MTDNAVSYPTPDVSTTRQANSDYFAAAKSGVTSMPYEPTTLEPVFKENPSPTSVHRHPSDVERHQFPIVLRTAGGYHLLLN